MIAPLKLVWRHKLIIYEVLSCSVKSDGQFHRHASECSALTGWVTDQGESPFQETHLHFSHSSGKVKQKVQTLSLIALVFSTFFSTDFCRNLYTVSKFPHIFLFHMSVPPVATTITQA